MSSNGSIVKVDKHVKIVLVHDFSSIGGGLHIDFDLRLAHRGSDFNVYANTGYNYSTFDTDLLAAILNALMHPRSGITSIKVQPFRMDINHNAAVETEEVMTQLQYAAQRAGYMVEYVDRSNKY
ncbi:MAG: hypothetical protein ABIR46_01625 [Candidatus Saccharimonadales bacterium]